MFMDACVHTRTHACSRCCSVPPRNFFITEVLILLASGCVGWWWLPFQFWGTDSRPQPNCQWSHFAGCFTLSQQVVTSKNWCRVTKARLLWTITMSYSSSGASHGIGWDFCCNFIIALLFPLPNPAFSLPYRCCFWKHLPKWKQKQKSCMQISLRDCFLGANLRQYVWLFSLFSFRISGTQNFELNLLHNSCVLLSFLPSILHQFSFFYPL